LTGGCGHTLQWRLRTGKARVDDFRVAARSRPPEDLEAGHRVIGATAWGESQTNRALRWSVVFEVRVNHRRGVGRHGDV
jgi:hypothetical protein